MLGLGIAVMLLIVHRSSFIVPPVWGLVAAGVPALLLGMWDDFHWKSQGLRGSSLKLQVPVAVTKLGLQFAVAVGAAGMLWLSGIRVLSAMPAAGLALAAAYVLGAMNAMNLEDGMDGLAAGEAVVSALGFAVLLSHFGRAGAAGMAVALAGALVGFLLLNWQPARMFLGDGGSHLVGAWLAVFAVVLIAVRGPAAVPGTALVIGLPVGDTVWVIVRRLAIGRRMMTGDRGHFYDLLHTSGLSVQETVVVCWLVHSALVATGVLWLLRMS